MPILKIKQDGVWVEVVPDAVAQNTEDIKELNQALEETDKTVAAVAESVKDFPDVVERVNANDWRITDNTERINANDKNISQSTERINTVEKRVTNLELAITPSPFVTDDTVAYAKVVPDNALPYAEISEIGGMTRKCANFLPLADGYKFTSTVNEGDMGHIPICNGVQLKQGTYTISFEVTQGTTNVRNTPYLAKTESSRIYVSGFENAFVAAGRHSGNVNIPEDGEYTFGWWCHTNATSQTISNIMLNEGSTALPYEPYFDGLRSAPVTAVESVGANLFDGIWEKGFINASGNVATDSGLYWRTKNYIYTPSEFVISSVSRTTISSVYVVSYDNEMNYIRQTRFYSSLSNVTYSSLPENTRYIRMYVELKASTNDISTVFTDVKVELGTIATPYTPYFKRIFEIPEAVQALGGYGWGVNESIYNYIDYEKKQFVKRVEKVVFDGSADENITIGMLGTEFTLFKFGISGAYNYSPAIINQDVPYKVSFNANDAHFYVNEGEVLFVLSNSIATDVATLKTYLASNPIEVIYELAEPIVTDISDILPLDNYIEVEGGGSVTMVNEHEYAVPSAITYQIKEATE